MHVAYLVAQIVPFPYVQVSNAYSQSKKLPPYLIVQVDIYVLHYVSVKYDNGKCSHNVASIQTFGVAELSQ